MDIDLGELNYLAVVAGIVINMAGGAAWYGILAKPWMAATGLTKEFIDEHKNLQYRGYAAAIVASILISIVLAILVQASGAEDALEGLAIGLLAGVGLVATVLASIYAFEGRSLKLYLINLGYLLLVFAILGGLFGAWQ